MDRLLKIERAGLMEYSELSWGYKFGDSLTPPPSCGDLVCRHVENCFYTWKLLRPPNVNLTVTSRCACLKGTQLSILAWNRGKANGYNRGSLALLLWLQIILADLVLRLK